MEKLYDRIVEVGGFAWQMFGIGPTPYDNKNGHCTGMLRAWCKGNMSMAEQRAVFYGVNFGKNASDFQQHAEQTTINFLVRATIFALPPPP